MKAVKSMLAAIGSISASITLPAAAHIAPMSAIHTNANPSLRSEVASIPQEEVVSRQESDLIYSCLKAAEKDAPKNEVRTTERSCVISWRTNSRSNARILRL